MCQKLMMIMSAPVLIECLYVPRIRPDNQLTFFLFGVYVFPRLHQSLSAPCWWKRMQAAPCFPDDLCFPPLSPSRLRVCVDPFLSFVFHLFRMCVWTNRKQAKQQQLVIRMWAHLVQFHGQFDEWKFLLGSVRCWVHIDSDDCLL